MDNKLKEKLCYIGLQPYTYTYIGPIPDREPLH
jgi:hypothetical protein